MERLSVMMCLFTVVMSCCSVIATCYPSCLPDERDVLLAFKNEYDDYMDSYAAEQYESWRGFNCCDWYGVQCSQYSSHVIGLNFSTKHMEYLYFSLNFHNPNVYKTLVPVLFQLSHMEYLDLSFNFFTGFLPKELFGLQKLRYLDLSYNRFEGEIPMDIGSLHTLTDLNLHYSGFQGRVPWQLGNLSHL
ncbi:hypothetical protein SUGI_0348560 [Cryptomeria japonica]|nr:hypothetical protein SUGI_0348560 [Cryptomeria japonica]